jgi:hypothetical protein
MKNSSTVETDNQAEAKELRRIADLVANGEFVAFAYSFCSKDGRGQYAGVIDSDLGTPDLIDEMVYDLKKALFESLEDDTCN